MSERRTQGVPGTIAAGLVIGIVEVVLAISFAALVFGARIASHLSDGIGLYLVAAALTLGILAWRGGSRGVVGSVQDAAAAVLAVVATTTALDAFGSPDRAFLTVVAATLVVTVLTGLAFFALGTLRLGNLVRFVPYPVVGGFLAGTGWLLLKGGIGVAANVQPFLRYLTPSDALRQWVPAVVFGAALLLATRLVRRPLVIPAGIAIGLLLFAVGMLVTGQSIDAAREGRWLLGPFESTRLWQPWTYRALGEADWAAVFHQSAGIGTAVFVAVIAMLFNTSGIELMLRTDLDSNRELRDASVVNLVSGALGGIPAYHALSLTSLAHRMGSSARSAGLIAALVPIAVVLFAAPLVELVPRMVVGGVLAFVGLAFLVEWVVDARKVLPRSEYVVVLLILATIAWRGLLPGVAIGLISAVVLFAVNYSRIELVRDVPFGETYRSNVDRPSGERAALRELGERVQILRVHGFVFFGTSSGLLERIRKRVEAAPVRFLVIDLRRVTGMDASAVMSFRKVAQLTESGGCELVLTGASETVRRQLERGGIVGAEGLVRFEPDLDRGLQACEDGLLEEASGGVGLADADGDAFAGMPPGLRPHLERVSLPAGTVLIHQDEPPDDLYVLESGRLGVELTTPEGRRMRVRTIRPGVVVGEVAMYTGVPRTADVVVDRPSEVLRLSRASIERIEAEEPELAAALHRWLATTLAERLRETMMALDALMD